MSITYPSTPAFLGRRYRGPAIVARIDVHEDADRGVVLRLVVRNHPGVMSHVCGLFARRAFNVDGILCTLVGDGATSVVLLLAKEDARIEQVVRQLRKLEDVREVGIAPDGHRIFGVVGALLDGTG